MSIEISWSRIASFAMRPQLFSGDQESTLGGPSLHIPRLGDRWAADVTTTQFRQDAESRRFFADLVRASTDDAKIRIRQPSLDGAVLAGLPVVDGAGQTGSSLAMRSMTPNATLLYGQFLSVIHAGVHFDYMVAAQTTAGPDGRATVPVWPMLRFVTVDGEQVSLSPMIEGKLTGIEKGMKFSQARMDGIEFSISERA